jgi:hypothetical protein
MPQQALIRNNGSIAASDLALLQSIINIQYQLVVLSTLTLEARQTRRWTAWSNPLEDDNGVVQRMRKGVCRGATNKKPRMCWMSHVKSEICLDVYEVTYGIIRHTRIRNPNSLWEDLRCAFAQRLQNCEPKDPTSILTKTRKAIPLLRIQGSIHLLIELLLQCSR